MDLTAAMGQTIDPMHLMQRVTDRTLDLIAVADGVMVGLADDQGVTYVCGAGHRISHLGTRVDLDSSLSGLAVRTGQRDRSGWNPDRPWCRDVRSGDRRRRRR